jgi:phenylalanyl-tRNA synthetase alpha chain
MVLFEIPDIRLFWTDDERFSAQFRDDMELSQMKFKPYSLNPPCLKDITFWLSPEFTENTFCALIREIAGDLVESVKLIDKFTKPSSGRTSHCYRIVYRAIDRNLTNEEVNELQNKVRSEVVRKLGVELR